MLKFFKFILWLFAAALLCLGLFFGIQAYVDGYSKKYIIDLDDAPLCDAILVLGAGVYGKTPSPVLEYRLIYAYRLYENKKAPKIIVSGDHGSADYDEVSVMKDYLIKMGVPRRDIFMDHAGFNTYDSMYRAKEIFGIESVLISTQNFHINRSIYIARRLGIKAFGYPSEDKEIYYMKALNARESMAKIKAFFDVEIFKRKPKFEGEAIPISGDGIATEG